MRIVRKEFTTLDNYNYYANILRRAINSSYIPTGDSIEEVINNFTKLQLSRSFSLGYSHALLSMAFDESALKIAYASTSGTEVTTVFVFDSNMEFLEGNLEVKIPEDRAHPGRCHYESITKEFYEYVWKLGCPPPEGVDESAMYPEWLFDNASNKIDVESKNKALLDMGYYPVKVIGMLNAWAHKGEPPVRYTRILEIERNYYKLLENPEDLFNRSYGAKSWRKLVDILKNDNEKDDFEEAYDEDYDNDADEE